MKRFRGELVFKAHRLLHHSTLGSRDKKRARTLGSAIELLAGTGCATDVAICGSSGMLSGNAHLCYLCPSMLSGNAHLYFQETPIHAICGRGKQLKRVDGRGAYVGVGHRVARLGGLRHRRRHLRQLGCEIWVEYLVISDEFSSYILVYWVICEGVSSSTSILGDV